MSRLLKEILAGVKKSTEEPLKTGEDPGVDYASKSKGDRDFVAKHKVEKHADRADNKNPSDATKETSFKKQSKDTYEEVSGGSMYTTTKKVDSDTQGKINDAIKSGKVKVKRIATKGKYKPFLGFSNSTIRGKNNFKSVREESDNEGVDVLETKSDPYAKKRWLVKMRSVHGKSDHVPVDATTHLIARSMAQGMHPLRKITGVKPDLKHHSWGDVKENIEITESKCNHTKKGKSCPVHGDKDCSKTTTEEVQIDEVITKKTSSGEVIDDFVHSKNSKFNGKSKKKRAQMALAAYYSKQREA